ncbi:predicted protein, partial [Nematostella vectensis]
TTERLINLRAQMKSRGLDAYIVPPTDAHQSEYISTHDMRRAFVSGFTGSAGTAVVTRTQAALWTDGRYYVQAAMELDDNWKLMRDYESGTPTITEWLAKVLQKGDKVGVDPYLFSTQDFEGDEKELNESKIQLEAVTPNLVDVIWADQPDKPNATLISLSVKYTGKTWQSKVTDMRVKMREANASALILYKLDEIAWLLNLRGSDVPFNPVFISYVIATASDVTLFIDKQKVTADVQAHLSVGSCTSMCVRLMPYERVVPEIKRIASQESSGKIWVSLSFAVRKGMTLLLKFSPVKLPKAIKNSVEIKGMRNAHLKDSVAISEFFHWMEHEVPKGRNDLTELLASAKLEEFKSKQAEYMGPSFFSIVGYGPNAAIIHYSPTKDSDRQITTDSTLLIDTGSQYKDGTCDTSRTAHFGTPTAEQKEAYTRVLKGHIQLSMMVWPNTTQGRFLDIIARKELWAGGLDYKHGTGHGIGMFLNVHEGNCAIGPRCPSREEHPIVPGMFTSDEPGYYKTGSFGIRIETVLQAVQKVKVSGAKIYGGR